GVLTVGVVTKPFSFEGNRRGRSADAGIEELQQHVDTLIVIPNQNLFRLANSDTTFKEAFEMADEVLQQGVRGITDLMVMPGLINLDFADVRSVMGEMGKAMMGTGEASGDNRAIEAAEKAISNPLLDGVSMKGAKGVIVSIVGGEDMRLMEVDEAASHIKELVDPDANIIWGSAFNTDLDGKIRVSVVATGIEAEAQSHAPPAPAKVFAFPGASRGAAAPEAKPAAAAPEPVAETAAAEAEAQSSLTELDLGASAEAEPLELDTQAADGDGDELLLDTGNMLGDEQGGESFIEDDFSGPEAKAPGTRSWITGEESAAAPARPAKAAGGTLFERMSNIARGADKAQVEEEPAPRLRREPLDIPRFLGRQNNQ
ncbi:MAG TPA: cell division protein FtsZ, partial [Allosphingosinicella sp.]